MATAATAAATAATVVAIADNCFRGEDTGSGCPTTPESRTHLRSGSFTGSDWTTGSCPDTGSTEVCS